ncbi:ABC-2 type transport system permease protein [Motilibacter rhizosphaerae]|uniref:Transport permease protein n=1 Tax=Motilibacter rhizosphaerae TaxID=598652 RepID=A0A4Q7NR45_9ACTN|nr:ABC transporter permease [Motilibacter rhizosphaerae]RZS87090.1 ABC-2 type transport system permease protein [Motilibacter rhizosphaerae]
MSASSIATEGVAAPPRRSPTALSVGLARAEVETKQFFRDREAVVFIFTFPLILMFIFGSVFSGAIAPGVSFRQYFVAGMIASGLMTSGFQNLAISVPVERDNGTLKRLVGTPMPRSSYFIGKIALILATTVGQLTLLIVLGHLLFGLDLPSDGGRWVTFVWLVLLGSAAMTMLGIAFSSIVRNGKSAPAVVSPVAIVLQFISGVFFQYDQLPSWMQHVAALFPLKWLTQGMRSVFLPDSFQGKEPAHSWEHGRIALVLAAWALAGLLVAVRTFRWQREAR